MINKHNDQIYTKRINLIRIKCLESANKTFKQAHRLESSNKQAQTQRVEFGNETSTTAWE